MFIGLFHFKIMVLKGIIQIKYAYKNLTSMCYFYVKIFNVLSRIWVKKTNTQVKGERLAVFLRKS